MQVTPAGFVRALFVSALGVWTLRLATAPMPAVLESFLHLVNLPFHEAGHIIFAPFGDFMMSLGGSLNQVLIPLVCAGALYFQTRDPFGALVCLWWAGENFVDLAPYIDDARVLQLMLLGGPADEVEGHDWEHILESLGWLRFDHRLAHAAHLIGVVIMVTSLALAAWYLWRATPSES